MNIPPFRVVSLCSLRLLVLLLLLLRLPLSAAAQNIMIALFWPATNGETVGKDGWMDGRVGGWMAECAREMFKRKKALAQS